MKALLLALAVMGATPEGSQCLKGGEEGPTPCEAELMEKLIETHGALELEKIESDFQLARYNAAQELCVQRVSDSENGSIAPWLAVAVSVAGIGLGILVGAAIW